MSKFDVTKHLIRIQGGREYLPVAYRLVWFREEHPDFGIATSPILIDLMKGFAVFHATVTDSTGRTVAEGTKMETARGFPDFLEKAETGSIGRALGLLGYGTQFAPEFDEGVDRIVDSPIAVDHSSTDSTDSNGYSRVGKDFAICAQCARPITKGQENLSQRRYGRSLCPVHQAVMKQ